MRFRKSVKLGPGLRLNASRGGLGLSAGTRGARYSIHSSGRRTTTVGVPGTGVSYSRSSTTSSKRKAAEPPLLQTARIPKPGMLAPKNEKEFAKAVQAFVDGKTQEALDHFVASAAADAKDRSVADDLFAGLVAAQTGDDALAANHLEKVIVSEQTLPDDLMGKYIPGGRLEIDVTENVSVNVEFGTAAAVLTLAEIYQRQARNDEAIGLLQQLVEVAPEPPLVLSLCELYAEEDAWDDLIEIAAGVANEDDITLAIRLYQAKALVARGASEAAAEAYRDCLRSKKRNPELLKAARYGRGLLYISTGKSAQGRRDLGAVYADDPHYEDIATLMGYS
jgi:tetratricopeptide (TPR) repeat protein